MRGGGRERESGRERDNLCVLVFVSVSLCVFVNLCIGTIFIFVSLACHLNYKYTHMYKSGSHGFGSKMMQYYTAIICYDIFYYDIIRK